MWKNGGRDDRDDRDDFWGSFQDFLKGFFWDGQDGQDGRGRPHGCDLYRPKPTNNRIYLNIFINTNEFKYTHINMYIYILIHFFI